MYPDPHDDLRAHREWLLSFINLKGGAAVVDFGCGRGDDLLTLAARQPDPAARFLGIDAAEVAIAAADARVGKDPRISFLRHRLEEQVPLETASVDVVYSNNLLECLRDPAAFAREVARVLRPGGVAVIAHWDFDSQVFDVSDKALARRLVHAYADWQQPWMERADGWMGRRLWGIFAPTGLFEGTVHARVLINTTYGAPWYGHARVQDLGRMVEHGLVRETDYLKLVTDLEQRSRTGSYFYSITGYAFVGRRRAAAA